MFRILRKSLRFTGNSASSWTLRASIGLCAVFAIACLSSAQVDRSGLSGTITDSSGRLLSQAHVAVVENATGLRRETVSDSSGTYDIPQLPVGTYVVTFEHEGFKKLEFVDVEQVIGRTRTLDATLQVAGSEERVEVSPASALMDHSTSAETGLIERSQADELPLNGRDWSLLTAFVPGAIDTGGGNQRSVRFAGRGLDDDNFTYDGVDATNIVNQTQRPWVRLSIPLDAISEFRVDSLMSTAEEGGTGGAQMAVTSPSGTNRFHGRLFEYLRNDYFDAPLPEWATPQVWNIAGTQQSEPKQPLHLNQFGGSLGGPIVHDKTFFFLASEAYRQNWGYPASGDVPSQAFIQSTETNAQSNSALDPILPILGGYPASTLVWQNTNPNGPLYEANSDAANYALVVCQCTQVVNENSFMLRLDQRFSSKTSGFMRFNYDRSVNTQPLSASATDLQQKVSAPINGALELLHVFTPSLVNEAHAGFNRSTNNSYNHSDSGAIYQIAVQNGAPGPGMMTANYRYVSIYVGNSISANDNLTWTHDRHTLKFGTEYRYVQMNQEHGFNGKITFNTIETLGTDTVKKASLKDPLPVNGLRKNDVFLYAQDEYKVRPNLTLNLGVRYTIFGLFDEKNGQAVPFDFATCGPDARTSMAQGYCPEGFSFGNQNYGDVDPRVGFAWTPKFSEKTVIRGGFGINHEDGQLDDQNLPAGNIVTSYSASGTKTVPISFTGGNGSSTTCNSMVTNLGASDQACAFVAGTYSPSAEQRDRKDTYVEQWSFSAQRELPADFVGTVSYLGSHGVHLMEEGETNLLAYNSSTETYGPQTQYPDCAPNANEPAGSCATSIGWRGSVGMSTYSGLNVSMRRPISRGLLVAANYTWSHEIDNGSSGSGDGDEIQPQNQACQACETASGAWDARHVVDGNAVYQLPLGLGKTMLNQRGIASTIAGNWELTTTALARTGFPVNVVTDLTGPDGNSAGTQRPDLATTASLTPSAGRTKAEWFNTSAFEVPELSDTPSQFGTAPRDLVRGPGTWQVDLGAGKKISLAEKGQLEFRAEFYNVFNHPQLGQPGAACTGSGSTSSATACSGTLGEITSTINVNTSIVNPITPVGSGTPREMQFALRLDF
jgi:hypothetical protein